MPDQSSLKGPGASVNAVKALRETNNSLGETLLTDGGRKGSDNEEEEPEEVEDLPVKDNGDADSETEETTARPEPEPETGLEDSQEIEEIEEEPPVNGDETETSSGGSGGIRSKFRDIIGIGKDHVLPEDAANNIISEPAESISAEELVEKTETFETDVSGYDTKRTEFEADVQAQVQANETVISEEVEKITRQLKHAQDVASEELSHLYDFDPERGSYDLETSLQNIIGEDSDIPSDQYDFDISDEGLATYLAEVTEMGDDAMQKFSDIQKDMEVLNDRREDQRRQLEELRSRNEDQLDSSRSRFTTGDEQERAEKVKESEDSADKAQYEREVSDIDDALSRKRPRKEQHLAVGNTLLNDARDAYESHASDVRGDVTEISEELDYLTNALENLTSAEIGEMDQLLDEYIEDLDVEFDTVGKHHSDAEGTLRTQHMQAVSALGVKIAQQYAQGQKAIEELSYLEDTINERTGRIGAERSSTAQEILDQSYEGEEFEDYLDNQMSQVLGADYSARDDIRNIFKGLEGMRDNKN